ncbi:sodium:solute symporter family protein [Neobacillus kokaensis]|uniref:Sodium:solute symporter n=1 Tax=Neobacillus kokaensis TaxID=2759023 RepID=A0ABQ3N9N1_9BACI|nr:sodium:solute symporter family protein [Neobacillus kokaensis]GHI00553.1 hypothetical protein AM1BK_40950 [Neobacillus kokaensis]
MTVFVFSVIMLLSIAIAFYSRRGKDVLNVEEYLVGGRSFSGFLLFFLAVGEIYSIGTMIGFPGGIYAKGPSYGIWFLGYILLAYPIGYFLAPLIWRVGKKYGSMTFPDMFRDHYSSRGLELIVTISALLFMIPWAQLQFEGLVVALSALGFNLSPIVAVAISGFLAFLYIYLSGVKAPALISVLKDILMFGAILVAGTAVFMKTDGVSNLFAMAKEQGASVTIGSSQALLFAMTTIFFQALAFYCTPAIAPVIFTGKSEATIKRTQRFMPLYMFMYPFLIATAYFSLVAVPNLDDPNHAFVATVMTLLPSWGIGLVAGGAALSGTLVLATYSLAVGGMVSRNLVKNVPESSQRRWVRIIVFLYLLVSMVLTLVSPSLMVSLINTASAGLGQFLPGLLAIFFFRKVTPIAIASGIIAGDLVVMGIYLAGITLNIHVGLLALILNVAVMVVVTKLTQNKKVINPVAFQPIEGNVVHDEQKFKNPPIAVE